MQKMERAENSDLDTSLAPVNMEIFFENKNLEEKFRLEYANLRIQLGKEIRVYISFSCGPQIFLTEGNPRLWAILKRGRLKNLKI